MKTAGAATQPVVQPDLPGLWFLQSELFKIGVFSLLNHATGGRGRRGRSPHLLPATRQVHGKVKEGDKEASRSSRGRDLEQGGAADVHGPKAPANRSRAHFPLSHRDERTRSNPCRSVARSSTTSGISAAKPRASREASGLTSQKVLQLPIRGDGAAPKWRREAGPILVSGDPARTRSVEVPPDRCRPACLDCEPTRRRRLTMSTDDRVSVCRYPAWPRVNVGMSSRDRPYQHPAASKRAMFGGGESPLRPTCSARCVILNA